MAGEVVERAAGRDDVDEAEQRGLSGGSSPSWEASSIAFSSASLNGLRDGVGMAAASRSPTAYSSCSSARSSTTDLTIPWPS